MSVDIKGIENGAGNIVENGDHIRLYYHMEYLGTTDYLTSPVSQKVTSWTHYNEWGEITHNAVLKCGQRELDMVKRYEPMTMTAFWICTMQKQDSTMLGIEDLLP